MQCLGHAKSVHVPENFFLEGYRRTSGPYRNEISHHSMFTAILAKGASASQALIASRIILNYINRQNQRQSYSRHKAYNALFARSGAGFPSPWVTHEPQTGLPHLEPVIPTVSNLGNLGLFERCRFLLPVAGQS